MSAESTVYVPDCEPETSKVQSLHRLRAKSHVPLDSILTRDWRGVRLLDLGSEGVYLETYFVWAKMTMVGHVLLWRAWWVVVGSLDQIWKVVDRLFFRLRPSRIRIMSSPTASKLKHGHCAETRDQM